MTLIALPLIFAFSFFIYGVTGFGSALVAMPLLTPLLGLGIASPLFALVSLTGESIMLFRYRRQLNIHAVWRLILASLIAIPIGIAIAGSLDDKWVLFLLGVLVSGYACYSLFSPALPQVKNPNWSYGFGFVGGLLSGAYNTGGPQGVKDELAIIKGDMTGAHQLQLDQGDF